MKLYKKIASAAMAFAMAASAGISYIPDADTTVNAADMTAIELVEDMGMGWNLGNTFDSYNVSGWTTDIETAWGNPRTAQSMITAIKNTGFNTVRIPITWAEKTDSSTYDIDDDYLARIKEVVDYCYAEDMYVIINMHWDFSGDGSSWLNQGLLARDQFITMWKEIANYFGDYDNKLVFEGMNEVTFDYSTLLSMNQAFVNTVRATGGNNADRLLLIAGKNTDMTDTCSSSFTMPTDDADMLAVSIHYYNPPTFCVATTGTSWGYTNTWGTDSDKQTLANNFELMYNTFAKKGIPVIIGEYGVLTNDNKDTDDIVEFIDSVTNTALSYEGICPVLWDTSNAGDMQFFDRENLKWYDTAIENVFKTANGEIDMEKINSIEFIAEALAETDEDGKTYWMVDLSPYRANHESGLSHLQTIVINGTVSSESGASAYSCGGAISFNLEDDETWAFLNWTLGKGDSNFTTEMNGTYQTGSDADGNAIMVESDIAYDYLKIEKWWDWSAATGDTVTFEMTSIKLIFSDYFYPETIDPSKTTSPEETTTTTSEETTTTTTTTETTIAPSLLKGDVNGDGTVNISDMVRLARYASQDTTLDPAMTAENITAADVNGDTFIDSGDITALSMYLAGLGTL